MTLVQTATTTREPSMLIPVPQVEPRVTIPLQNLRIPGPTPVPAAVLAELARPVINHRGPEFAAILRRVTARLQYVFQTTAPVDTLKQNSFPFTPSTYTRSPSTVGVARGPFGHWMPP